MPFDNMCSAQQRCTETTFPFLYWLRVTAKRKQAGCGLTFGTIVRLAARNHQLFGLPTHRIESRNGRSIIYEAFVGPCRPTRMPALIGYMNKVWSWKRHAGHMSDVSFMICMKRTNRRSPRRHSDVSRRSMESRKKSAAGHRMNGYRFAMHELGHCWMPCASG